MTDEPEPIDTHKIASTSSDPTVLALCAEVARWRGRHDAMLAAARAGIASRRSTA